MENISSPSTSASSNASVAAGRMSGNGASHADNVVTRGVEAAGAALHSGIDKVADPARGAVDNLSSAAHNSVNKLASSATSTADHFSDQTRRLTEAPGRAVEFSKSWFKDKPLEAVGAALVFGFIVGRLTSR